MENKTKYSPEQVGDINSRITAAIAYLKSVELEPAAYVQKVNLGQDVFADKVTPMLRDLKYEKKAPAPTEIPAGGIPSPFSENAENTAPTIDTTPAEERPGAIEGEAPAATA